MNPRCCFLSPNNAPSAPLPVCGVHQAEQKALSSGWHFHGGKRCRRLRCSVPRRRLQPDPHLSCRWAMQGRRDGERVGASGAEELCPPTFGCSEWEEHLGPGTGQRGVPVPAQHASVPTIPSIPSWGPRRSLAVTSCRRLGGSGRELLCCVPVVIAAPSPSHARKAASREEISNEAKRTLPSYQALGAASSRSSLGEVSAGSPGVSECETWGGLQGGLGLSCQGIFPAVVHTGGTLEIFCPTLCCGRLGAGVRVCIRWPRKNKPCRFCPSLHACPQGMHLALAARRARWCQPCSRREAGLSLGAF